METQQKNKTGVSKLFVVLFILSLILNVFLFFRYVKKGKQLERQNSEMSILLEESKINLDSLQKEYAFIEKQLEQSLNENLALQDLREDIRTQLEEKIVELQRAKNRIGSMIVEIGLTDDSGRALSIVEAKNAISKLKRDNEAFVEQLGSLKYDNQNYVKKVEESEKQLSEVILKKDKIQAENKKMEEKLSVASILRIGNLSFDAIRDKGSKTEVTDRASRLSRFKISLNILPSEVTDAGEKKLDFRILGTNNEVLSAGNTSLMDSDKLISTSQVVDYDGSKKNIVVYFTPNEERLKSGRYKLEVYEGVAIIGTKSIQLR
jgi:hypothetical protein